MTEPKYEEMLKKLEGIVEKLETGNLPLEESVKIFEEGMKLSKSLNKRLAEAERKVSLLVKEKGEMRLKPFPETNFDDGESD